MIRLSKRLFHRPTLTLLGLSLFAAVPVHAADNSAAASEERLRKDVFYLASDELEGRGPTTKGIDKAADYIAAEFKKAGLRPGGVDGTYFQPFPYPASVLDAPARLTLKGPKGQEIELKQGDQFNPMGLGRAGKLTAPIVFAGYGITSAAAKYDDYEGIDATDKVVIVLRDSPHCTTNEEATARLKASASFTRKIANAEKHKAAAVLFVNDAETARGGDDLLDFNFTAVGRIAQESNLPAFHVRRSVLQTMLAASGPDLADLESRMDKDLKPQSLELMGWTGGLEVKAHKGAVTLKNVIGILDGKGPLNSETIVVGAHYDHLGYGGAGGSMMKTIKKPIIHPGADDNASGSAAMMELARRFGAAPDRVGRRLVFVCFSGEEIGLEGSKYYCDHPLFPLEETAAMFNLDMVGRLRPDEKSHKDNVLVEGAGTGKNFTELVDAINKKYDFNLAMKSQTLPANSDHFSFYKKKVPVLFFWTGNHPDYHKPSDTADKVNVVGMNKIVDLSADVISVLDTEDKRPEYQVVKVNTAKRSDGPTLRIMPNYTDEGDGLLLDGVADDGPAAKAGLRAGDRIVEVAGAQVKNITTYMEAMSAQKRGETIAVVVVRDGKRNSMKVKLDP